MKFAGNVRIDFYCTAWRTLFRVSMATSCSLKFLLLFQIPFFEDFPVIKKVIIIKRKNGLITNRIKKSSVALKNSVKYLTVKRPLNFIIWYECIMKIKSPKLIILKAIGIMKHLLTLFGIETLSFLKNFLKINKAPNILITEKSKLEAITILNYFTHDCRYYTQKAYLWALSQIQHSSWDLASSIQILDLQTYQPTNFIRRLLRITKP